MSNIRVFLATTCLSIFILFPIFSSAQNTPPGNTGTTHTVTPTQNQTTPEENLMKPGNANYRFIAPIEPLIRGIIDVQSGDNIFFANVADETALQDYLRGWFRFLIGIGGVIGVIRLVFAGFSIIIGSSKPGQHSIVREELVSIITSLVLIAGSWVFLNTINPRIVDSNIPFAVISTAPAEPLIQSEPTKEGWYFQYQVIESGKVRYEGPFNNNALADSTLLQKAYIAIRTIGQYGDDIVGISYIPGYRSLQKKSLEGMSCSFERAYYNANVPIYTIQGYLFEESVRVLSECTYFPKEKKTNPDGTPVGVGTSYAPYAGSEDDNRKTFLSFGIGVNKDPCKPGEKKCTNVGNLDAKTLVAHFKKLAQVGGFTDKCSDGTQKCPITVTGGGEPGHQTHGGPYTLDIRKSTDVERTLKEKALVIAPGLNSASPRYYFEGYWYNDEIKAGTDPHFHVCKHQPPINSGEISNERLCGFTWSPDKTVKPYLNMECKKNPNNENQWLCRSDKNFGSVPCPLPICKTQWQSTGTEKDPTKNPLLPLQKVFEELGEPR